ncbi:hypothetical protein [Winogradskya humida]|uniref:Antitoxin VapB n=1 Tax=Winogradskya humida TaxID=113566 RepID=A0ABQ3ZSB5_9ACTN|nr:hypothetical protein [Actinoplanes humidus]GIE21480.1 hypothetical protein Ahu01nite_045820 [Actinoplanes humidus]
MEESPRSTAASRRLRATKAVVTGRSGSRTVRRTVRNVGDAQTGHEATKATLRPAISVPASQAWFWTEGWQEGERRADADVVAGRTTTYDNVDDFMDSLDIDE